MRTARPYCEVDIECYPDWFLIKFYVGDDTYSFDMHAEDDVPLNLAAIHWFIERFTLVGFNSDNYDVPMMCYALQGATCSQLKTLNDHIIVGGLKRWHVYESYGMQLPPLLDHVDIMEVAPGVRVGLKAYMGRMHSPTLEDLPYDPSQPTTRIMRAHLDSYCGNDLKGTRDLRKAVAGRLAMREAMGEKYGVDLRSKSDAQMAEGILKSQLGFKPEKRVVPHGYKFQYQPPAFIRFQTPVLQQMFEVVKAAWFVVYDVDQLRSAGIEQEEFHDDQGKKIKTGVKMPPELKTLIPVGLANYQFGIGGLHSTEQSQAWQTIMGKWTVSDHDVNSYYPSLILLLAMYPEQLGPIFLEIYGRVYLERLAAKAEASAEEYRLKGGAGDHAVHLYWKTIADGLKIVLNGTFGKLFSKYSILFAPELGIQVTITGQLCMLMLIEMLEQSGIRVISANTDGLVMVTPVGREWLRDQCIKYWEHLTGLTTEATFYKAIYQRDVNSYVAIKMDGSHKGKGAFAESGVLNNVHPEKDICADAVIAFLTKGAPIADTIRQCTDIRKFLIIRNVKGGGIYYPKTLGPREQVINEQGAVYLGKVVRWYYGAGVTDSVHYKPKPPRAGLELSLPEFEAAYGELDAKGRKKFLADQKKINILGNKVAGSTGARVCMSLPATFPTDIDYDHYIQDAIKMLGTLGVNYA